MASLTSNQKREWAQVLYTKERLAQKEIASKVGTSEKTVSAWKEKYGWDKLRQSLLVTKEEQIRRIYHIIDTLTEAAEMDVLLGSTKMADMLVKYTASVKNLETETSLAQIIDVGTRFLDFLRAEDLHRAKDIAPLFDAFIQQTLAGK